MLSILVFKDNTGMFFMELCKNGKTQEWFPCRAKCKEHAEAEAMQRWPGVPYINEITLL